jgi:hypothetical protein
MAEFDLKRVTPLEWAGGGAGALAFIASFFPWYSIDFEGFGGGSLSAWNTGFLAWFSVLLLMVAGGLVLAPKFGMKAVDRLPLIWLILAGVATVFILIRWLTLPGWRHRVRRRLRPDPGPDHGDRVNGRRGPDVPRGPADGPGRRQPGGSLTLPHNALKDPFETLNVPKGSFSALGLGRLRLGLRRWLVGRCLLLLLRLGG